MSNPKSHGAPAQKAALDNHANQLNSNNTAYWSSRGVPAPAPQPQVTPSAPSAGSGSGGAKTSQK